ncbi:MAG: nucleotidyl transferase AbiEii/AbiGii toxin family protein [Clostridia bacterium]|nr:nucleotidyl transferase AbiEii/AbiGii toxin family protein [Clostridia bacterium]
MIKTSRQLKDKIRNLSGGNSDKALYLLRNYMMERFLERVSLSDYKDRFILKGGLLVSSLVGVDMRATMDIDTTVKALPLTVEDIRKTIEEIIRIDAGDNIDFFLAKETTIMEDFDYPGVRLMVDCFLESTRQTIKIDVSTNDVITPGAIEYNFPLMFENRTIPLLTYNTETLLAEKLETVLVRGVENTRMRDYYDIHIITQNYKLDYDLLRKAFLATVNHRNSDKVISNADDIINDISENPLTSDLWQAFKKANWFVSDLSWSQIIQSLKELNSKIQLNNQ